MALFDWQRVGAMVRKELRQQVRDPLTLRIMAIAPLMQLLVLGFAVTNDPRDLRLAYLDLDHTPASRRVVQQLAHVTSNAGSAFVIHQVDTQEQLLGELDSGAAQVTLQIPPGFARRLARGQQSPVQVMADGSDTSSATLATAYLAGTLQGYSGEVAAEWRERHGGGGAGALEVASSVWYNPGLVSRNYVLPGVVSLVLGILASTLTVLGISREREVGTLEQLLVTPLATRELMVGKMVVPIGIALVDAVLVVVLSVLLFGVPFLGNPLFLLAAIVPYVVSMLGAGLLISTVARSQQQAQLLNFFYNLPQNLLSGFIFPVATMPVWAQYLSLLIPQRYVLEVVRGVYLKGLGPVTLWPQLLALCVLSLALLAAGIRVFRRRLD